jgi:chromosome segregation ATPase
MKQIDESNGKWEQARDEIASLRLIIGDMQEETSLLREQLSQAHEAVGSAKRASNTARRDWKEMRAENVELTQSLRMITKVQAEEAMTRARDEHERFERRNEWRNRSEEHTSELQSH